MAEIRTERGACRFAVHKGQDQQPIISLQLFHNTVSVLNNATVGFDLLGGTTAEQEKKVADMLNERVLNVFVSLTDKHPMY
jgi:hypothetical protein